MALGLHLSPLNPSVTMASWTDFNPMAKSRQETAQYTGIAARHRRSAGRATASASRAEVQGRRGTSMVTHISLGIIFLLLIIRLGRRSCPRRSPTNRHQHAVFLPTPGPGGGGGGGGDKKPEPLRKAQVEQKKDPISVPAPVTPDHAEVRGAATPRAMTIPFKPMSEAEMTLPGVVSPSAPTTGGAGAGPGTGAGSGQGRDSDRVMVADLAAAHFVRARASRCRKSFAK